VAFFLCSKPLQQQRHERCKDQVCQRDAGDVQHVQSQRDHQTHLHPLSPPFFRTIGLALPSRSEPLPVTEAFILWLKRYLASRYTDLLF